MGKTRGKIQNKQTNIFSNALHLGNITPDILPTDVSDHFSIFAINNGYHVHDRNVFLDVILCGLKNVLKTFQHNVTKSF